MDIATPARKWASRLLKAVWFVLISFLVGRTLGPSTAYINHDIATAICEFIYDDVNAETMYETYINADILILVTLTTVFYFLTMKLFNKKRNK
ncbi:hypothetical protein E0L16_18930 [Enterobacter quasihormaechei]|uniref:Uncharacterized protein n=1 Tax=Enterobacter quasihormaechei TaxID=2529382 RepID=A0AAE8QTD7_9ENTR|nr:hypothetical protein E0L16_18930 [Enterobacter quasihormaechei]